MSFLYKKTVAHLLTALAILYISYYTWWRFTETINPSALLFSIIFIIVECQGILNFLLFSLMTWNIDKGEIPVSLEGLKVDVFVPTYNEELEILESTLIGCVNMDYPHTTYVLDDGRRPQVEALAKQLGCIYLTRADNKHAKAGNINEALKKTDGDFIAIFDADMVPQPDFLVKTLGYFRDKKTAIVQLPQEFYNLDSIQHQKNASWHEQKLFYRVIQPGKNSINSAFWCGSPSIVRREALDSIGGVATESITEDFLTSIKLNSKGWKIKYHNEVLAFGIAPQSLYAFNLQRLRWAQGAMKILKSRYNPLIVPGLTLKQRLSHFSAILTYFDSYQKLVYLLLPSVYLVTGILPVKVASGADYLIHWAPYFLLTLLSNIALGRGYFRYIEVEKYNMLKLFTFIKASFTILVSKNLVFRVTPKVVDDSVKKKERRELKMHIVILIIIILSVLVGTINIIGKVFVSYSDINVAITAILWSIFNVSILGITLYDVIRRLYYRNDYRFPIRLDSKIIELNGEQYESVTTDISRTGIGIIKKDTGEIGRYAKLSVILPDGVLNLSGNVVYDRPIDGEHRKVGIKFEELSLEDRKRLISYLFIKAPREKHHADELEKQLKQTNLINPVET
jgi:cellulose synthase (UDP-forming)